MQIAQQLMPNGMGAPGIYPPLAGSDWLDGNDERLIKIALHGLQGPMKVNGKDYGHQPGIPPMTRFNELIEDDKEMAAVLTYVRNSWGNKGEVMKPEKVAEVRKANAKRDRFWEPAELLKAHPLKN